MILLIGNLNYSKLSGNVVYDEKLVSSSEIKLAEEIAQGLESNVEIGDYVGPDYQKINYECLIAGKLAYAAKTKDRKWLVIDAKGQTLGRLATKIVVIIILVYYCKLYAKAPELPDISLSYCKQSAFALPLPSS